MILILLSTYNGEKYLEDQLQSLIAQEGVDIHILVRDDGSTDKTIDILEKYCECYPSLFTIHKGENIGYALSFTELLKIAYADLREYQYFAFCDQDDVWKPAKLQVALEKLHNQPQDIPCTYCSNTIQVDQNLNFLKKTWGDNDVRISKSASLLQSFATGCTMVFNRKAVELYVTYTPRKILVHDYLMYQVCVFLGLVVYDENAYILYRQHGNNQIGMPSAFARWKNRITGKYKKGFARELNSYFLEAFKSLLSLDDIGVLSKIVYYNQNFILRLALLFDPKIKFNNLESNLLFIFKVLLGCI